MTIRSVVFDRDGVLTYFDTARAAEDLRTLVPVSVFQLGAVWQEWGASTGFPTSLEEERIFFHRYWDHVADMYDLDPVQRARLKQLEYTHYVRPFVDARPALAALRGMGVRIGVLSNFTLASLPQSLAATGLLPYVDAACAAQLIGSAKPAAAAYRYVLDALDVSPEETLFFDDEAPCVDGAAQVGLDSYRVDRKRSSHDLAGGVVCNLLVVPELVSALQRERWPIIRV